MLKVINLISVLKQSNWTVCYDWAPVRGCYLSPRNCTCIDRAKHLDSFTKDKKCLTPRWNIHQVRIFPGAFQCWNSRFFFNLPSITGKILLRILTKVRFFFSSFFMGIFTWSDMIIHDPGSLSYISWFVLVTVTTCLPVRPSQSQYT